ncbi:alpha/beta fold hydrolase [Streptomyces sporangiiformans]|uniref:Alpha/beta hydrolase n=1 Tax=Streptomyces sporangiiformans TaxID=2315329 RepID=A0A505DJT9_9ACTN|nr:alpha/beta hydrolase [Streptomyces sporangiiformans]TPQ22655.1 alpha/beta hydrolase [Streptomyces sporangiiformans]
MKNSLTEGSSFTSVDGMRVRFVREGRGPAVLLLHGSGSSLDTFDEVAARLRPAYEVIRLDLPGFGLTGPRPDRDYRIESYVAFVARFLDGQSVDTCMVAGNSLGGNIAWNFALTHPERVRRLVLMNSTGYVGKSLPVAMRLARNPLTRPLLRRAGSRGMVARNVRGMVGPDFTVPEAMVDRMHAMMSRPGNRAAFIDLARTDQADRTPELRRLRVPTLVLRGDGIDGQHFARDIPGSQDIVLPGIGHLMPEEAPTRVAGAMLEFLGGQS